MMLRRIILRTTMMTEMNKRRKDICKQIGRILEFDRRIYNVGL